MKKLLLTFAIAAALCPAGASAQKGHRATFTEKADVAEADKNEDSITVYSDTTFYAEDSLDAEEYDSGDSDETVSAEADYDDDSGLFGFFMALSKSGPNGVLIALFVTLICALGCALPIILLVLILRYLMKRHERREEYEQRLIEQGVYPAAADGGSPAEEQTAPRATARKRTLLTLKNVSVGDEYMWRKGIRNVSIGIGLAIMFGCWGATALVGVGLLVLCLGAGQMFIACATGARARKDGSGRPSGGASAQSEGRQGVQQ